MTGKMKLLLGVFSLLAVVVAAVVLLTYQKDDDISPASVEVVQERPFRLDDAREGLRQEEPELNESGPSSTRDKPSLTRESESVSVPGATPAWASALGADGNDYQRLLAQVKSFCDYLDGRDYVKEYDVAEGTYLRMVALLANLVEYQPFIVAESIDLRRLAANLYHFYRIMGEEETLLAAEIMIREREKLAAVMALIYNWLMLDMEQDTPQTAASIESLYHYGGFFLETLGGISYLARRDSRTVFLVRYYSLLLVDQADRRTKNPYGIDLLPHLEKLDRDLELIKDIDDRDGYEARLSEIRDRLVRR